MGDDKLKPAVKATFSAYLQSKGLRRTPERLMVLERAMEMSGHFTVEALHESISSQRHLSLATVYNTLQLLMDAGIVSRHQFDGQTPLYGVALSQEGHGHQHLVCVKCGKVKEVRDPELDKYLNAKRYTAFTASHFLVTVYGVCSSCARRRRKSTKR
jgi:Fur family ferric uptake transcriptional regulator